MTLNDLLSSDLTKAFIAGQVRHFFTGLGGALVTAGAVQADQQGAFVQIGSGMVLYGFGAAWSWWQKADHAKIVAGLRISLDYWRDKKTPAK